MAIKFTDGLLGNETISFEMVVCANCKVPFMLQANHIAKLRNSGDTFYCPNGHPMVYGKSCNKEKEKLKSELEIAWNKVGERTSEVWRLTEQNRELRKKQCPHCKKKFIKIDAHIKKYHS